MSEFISVKVNCCLLLIILVAVWESQMTNALEINGTIYPDPDVGLVPLTINFKPYFLEKLHLIPKKVDRDSGSPQSRAFQAAPRYYLSTFKANAYVADSYCRRSGRSLLSIETDDQQKTLELYIIVKGITDSLWTSGNDIHQEGKWVWGNDEEIFYNNFLGTQVNSDEYNCISFSTTAPYKFNWIIDYCGDYKYFICES